jgi:ribonuclease-3
VEKVLQRRTCEESLEGKIGYRFNDTVLLRGSLTHKSFSNEQPGRDVSHNERLEFLGDAVLDLVVSHLIFRAFTALAEGELTRIRAEVVSEKSLAAIGRQLDLGNCLELGRGEERSGGRNKASLVADALEALLGAVFCDGGFESARLVIETLFAGPIERAVREKDGVDHKTRLQELLQARQGQPPAYVLTLAEGPDHQRSYTVEVRFDGKTVGCGRGRTKKAAEQEAAREALARLGV